jgi:hypothetical protein
MHVRRRLAVSLCALVASGAAACDAPNTRVVLDNDYPPSTSGALVVYRAFWQAVSFSAPVLPGSSSALESTVAASENTAWAVLAPGWDPAGAATDGGAPDPASLIVLESRAGFAVQLNQTLHIPVDDTSFAGRCAAGSRLAQDQADLATQQIFAGLFAGLQYDAATCTSTGGP